jgi:SAM-dependent methyltransferase
MRARLLRKWWNKKATEHVPASTIRKRKTEKKKLDWPREAPAIFVNQYDKPLTSSGLHSLWMNHLVKLGYALKGSDRSNRSGKGLHELRDCFRTLWSKTAARGEVAEWMMGHLRCARDVNTKFLDRLNLSNLEIRRHDILKDNLEVGLYNLAHCRNVLHHLSDPEKVVRRMADALRQGGWIVLEEPDHGSALSTDVTDPSTVSYKTTYRTLLDYYRRKGVADFYLGRQVRGFVEALGYDEFGQEGWTCMSRADEPMGRMMTASWEVSAKQAIAEAVITQEQYDAAMRLVRDPTFDHPEQTIFSAWGRKPGERMD